jgi:hypothetical protein
MSLVEEVKKGGPYTKKEQEDMQLLKRKYSLRKTRKMEQYQ